MSEKFEKAIQDWYDHSRTANLEYLNLSEKPKVKLSEIENNISVVFDRLLIFSKVTIKHFRELEHQNHLLEEKLTKCEELLQKTLSETRKSFRQISSEVRETKPLTKKEVLELVQEISQQPKLVEEEALKLTTELNTKIQQVEHQVKKVEHLLTEVQRFLTT